MLQRRTELGLTQREVAEALGLQAKEFVGFIERGTRQPNYERLPALAKILETSVVTLFQLVIWDSYPNLAKLIFGKKAQPIHVVHLKSEVSTVRKLNALPLDSKQVITKMINDLYADHMGQPRRRA